MPSSIAAAMAPLVVQEQLMQRIFTKDRTVISTVCRATAALPADVIVPFQFAMDSVVPDVVDILPEELIEIKYSSGVIVENGNELTPTQVKDAPSLISWPTEEGALYTLVMTDPDAPSRKEPTVGEVQHWLVVNIPGTNVNDGQLIADYLGSGPPLDTGLHRYIFLIYRQPGQLTLDENVAHEKYKSNRVREGRLKFKIRDFAKKHNLGNPVAVNFFKAQYDDWVPKRNEMFK